MKRTLVLSDLHGRYKALLEVLERSSFNPETDRLVLLGDLCDGGKQTKECVELLISFPDVVLVQANHDFWFKEFMNTRHQRPEWIGQGGAATLKSYGAIPDPSREDPERSEWAGGDIPQTHKEFFNNAVPFHIEDGMLFVHGGFDPVLPIETNEIKTIMWDRCMAYATLNDDTKKYEKYFHFTEHEHIFLGHTAIKEPWLPKTSGRITLLDTGAGHKGKLTLMDIHSKEYWQSDVTGSCSFFINDDIVEVKNGTTTK